MNLPLPAAIRHQTSEISNDFIQRAASAITHPATLASLAVLLLNDLLFKSLWPHAWLTGKLSDLAWLVLALPLLAFLLSFLVRIKLCSPRVASLAAYLGLPLLYLAFNTFQSVHYWILKGISVASGGTAGSPQDVTDSLVIPLGWLLALWVWRRPPVPSGALRMRLALLVAAVASLASVATSYPEPFYGVTNVTVGEDGAVYASIGSDEGYYTRSYVSTNGGRTWSQGEAGGVPTAPGVDSVDTPRGRYILEGTDIVLVRINDSRRRVVYSTAFLKEPGNEWVQAQATSGLDARRLAQYPSSIVYHPGTGNVIAALGIQGVLVGAPDGRWIHVGVGAMRPSDFSFLGKTQRLLSNPGFLAASLVLAFSMTGMGLILSQVRNLEWGISAKPLLWVLVGLVVGGLLLFGTFLGFFAFLFSAFLPLLVLGPLVLAVAIGSMRRQDRGSNILTLGIGVVSVGLAALLLLIFGGSETEPGSMYNFWLGAVAVAASLMTVASLAVSWQLMTHWRPAAASLLGMFLVTLIPFMLWLHLGIELLLAKASALVLTSVIAIVLMKHVRRRLEAEETTCRECGAATTAEPRNCENCGAPLTGRPDSQRQLDIPALKVHRLTGFGQRFGAALLDLLFVYIIFLVLASVLSGGGIFLVYGLNPPVDVLSGLPPIADYTLFFFLPGAVAGALFVRMFNATLGKRFLGLQLVRTDGSEVDLGRAFLREMVRLSPLSLFSIFMIAVRSDKRGLHDLIADTLVIEKP